MPKNRRSQLLHQKIDCRHHETKLGNVLPVGFYDLLFEEANQSRNLINLSLDSLLENNFKLIETSLIEFNEEFPAANLQNQSASGFFSVDPISGKSLVLRSDITLQIARLMNSRLKNHLLPLRLCYAGDVFLPQSNQLFVDRKQTQLGFEIIFKAIDKNNKNPHLEAIQTLLETLQKLGLKNLTIVVSLPDLLENFLEALQEQENQALKQAIIDKNLSKIREFGGKNAELIRQMVMESNLAAISHPILNQEKLAKNIACAAEIAEFIAKNFGDYSCEFDIFGDNLVSYHHEIAFDVFARGFTYPVARGGGYQISCPQFEGKFEEEANAKNSLIQAVGATIYINFLMRVLSL